MYKITLTKNRKEVIFHTEEEVDMEVALLFLLGFKAYRPSGMNLHIDKYIGEFIDEDFSISELLSENKFGEVPINQ